MTSGHTRVVLLALVVAAVAATAGMARLVGLDHLVVWHDEVFTLIRAFGYPQAEVQQAIFSGRLLEPGFLLGFQAPDPARGWDATLAAFMEHPEHAPLYYALVRLAAELPAPWTPEPMTAARGVSALFGLILIPAVYWLMRELFGRSAAPWVAALLVACSPLQFLYAQEARQYSLWTLMVVLSSAALVRALSSARGANGAGGKSGRAAGDWWLYGLLVTLGLYSHLLFALMLPVHAAYLYLARRDEPLGATARPWTLAVGASLVAFGPWLLVVLTRREQAGYHTEWMARPIGLQRILEEWATHLTRMFVDLSPSGSGWWALLLIPAAWALLHFLRRAPRPAAWLLAGMALIYVGVVLGPDLILGGSRSQHVRYALPSVLAVQLMAAWVIGEGLDARSYRTRTVAAGTLALLAVLGGLSIIGIQRADTWWTKNFSASNGEVARILNRSERPLVLASDSGVGTGELISLAYRLDPQVRIWGERGAAAPPLAGFTNLVALMPSPTVQTWLGPERAPTPVAGTWQWFEVKADRRVGDRTEQPESPTQTQRERAANQRGETP